jgi:hypothetical protein
LIFHESASGNAAVNPDSGCAPVSVTTNVLTALATLLHT